MNIEEPYRHEWIYVRDTRDNSLQLISDTQFWGIESVPTFAARWALDAAKRYGNHAILTATINASKGCPIGSKALCWRYCFAHRSWHASNSPNNNVDECYLQDMDMLSELWKDLGIFMSYDTEPFPGGIICEISRKILAAMIKKPPRSLLIHSHTANVAKPETLQIIKEVAQATDLIVGIWFETDIDNVGEKWHFHNVEERLTAFEKLNQAGIRTQASTTPLLWFRDYPGFIRRFYEMWTYRIMIGELRKEFIGGGDERACELNIGLEPLNEECARQICAGYNFLGWVWIREDFYVTMT